jgi:alpha-1,6-mannosyltransferase
MDLVKPHQTETSTIHLNSLQIAFIGLGLISGLLYFFNFRIRMFFLQSQLIGKTAIHFYVFLFAILSALYLFGIYLIFKYRPRRRHSNGLTVIILIFAAGFRASLIPADPSVLSKDMYRYIWDGRVQQNGINPYLYPPDAEQLNKLRDDKVYPNINRKSYRTLYPAGAQLSFRILHMIAGDSVFGYKALMTLFDLLTLFALMALLRVCGFEKTRLLVYAWNPLVIFEIAYSGHLEGITVFFMVLAFYLNATNKEMLGVVALAVSSATKLYPAILLPALLNPGQRVKGILCFALAVVLLYVPFLTAGSKVLGFLPNYLQNPAESFNLGIKYFMMNMLPQLHYYLLSKVFLLAVTVVGLFIFFKNKKKDQALWYAYLLTGLLMVLMPASLHAWYLIILIPFLSFYPAVAWLIFSITVTLSYLKYVSPAGTLPTGVLMLEYVPLFTLLAGGYMLNWYAHRNQGNMICNGPGRRYFLERISGTKYE